MRFLSFVQVAPGADPSIDVFAAVADRYSGAAAHVAE
jgi:hypothetical protein